MKTTSANQISLVRGRMELPWWRKFYRDSIDSWFDRMSPCDETIRRMHTDEDKQSRVDMKVGMIKQSYGS